VLGLGGICLGRVRVRECRLGGIVSLGVDLFRVGDNIQGTGFPEKN